MKATSRRMLRTLAILTAIFVAPVWAQDEDLPDAPGKALTARVCSGCHGVDTFAGVHKTSDEWDRTITTMTERGLMLTDAEYATVLDYFSKNMGPAPAKVNINKASAAELQKALGITTAQADAIVAYRAKNGGFKDLESVKKVSGVDAAAIDAKKNSIAF